MKSLIRFALPLAGAAAATLTAIVPAHAATAAAADPIPTFDYSACPPLPAGASTTSSVCTNAVVTSGSIQLGSVTVNLSAPISLTFASFNQNHKYTTVFGALNASTMLVKPGIFGDPILTAVYGKPQYAGGFTTSNFNITMGMKVLLTNPFIGNSCYIGTDSNPISLHLITGTTNPPPPNTPITGSPATIVSRNPDVYQLTNVDNSFSVPGATGCALNLGLVNGIVDSQAGIPAAAGTNTMIFHEYASLKTYAQLAGN